MLDRVTGMQVFARVAALGSLSAAARALGMSQTMATKHIAALEERLSAKLLNRSTRRMTLTEAGRDYLQAVERILSQIEEADATAARATVEVRGTLRLNAPVSFGVREIAPLLPKLAAKHGELSVELGLNDRQVDPLEEGWDLIVRIGNLKDSSLVARRLAPCRMVVCAAPAYFERYGQPATVHDLQHHNCLNYTLSRTVGQGRWTFGPKGEVTVSAEGNLRSNNGDVLLAAALAGQGIIYQPTFLASSDIKSGRLVSLKLDHPTIELAGIYAVYPSTWALPAKVRAAIDFLAAAWGPLPPWDTGLFDR